MKKTNVLSIIILTSIFFFARCGAQEKEEFDPFIKKFTNDTIFQANRVKYPLEYKYIDSENFEEKVKFIERDAYKSSNLYYSLIGCSEAYTVFYDNFDLKFRESNQRVFRWKGFTGMDERYFFEKISGIWFLIKIEILGT